MHLIQHMKSLMFEVKLLHSQNSHVGHLNSICGLTHMLDFIDSNINLFIYLIGGIRFGTWEVRCLNWA